MREHGSMVEPVRAAGEILHRQMIRGISSEYDAPSRVLDPERSNLAALRVLGSHRSDPGVRSVDHDTDVRWPLSTERISMPSPRQWRESHRNAASGGGPFSGRGTAERGPREMEQRTGLHIALRVQIHNLNPFEPREAHPPPPRSPISTIPEDGTAWPVQITAPGGGGRRGPVVQDQSPPTVPLNRFFSPFQHSM